MSADFAGYYRRAGVKTAEIDGRLWAVYQRMAVPAGPLKTSYAITPEQGREILKKTGALLVRETRGFAPEQAAGDSDWYAVICDRFRDLGEYSSKDRNKMRKGFKYCSVRRVDAEEIAEKGYDVFSAAFGRYRGVRKPVFGRKRFKKDILETKSLGGAVHYWGVYCGGRLVGYSQNMIYGRTEANYAVVKFDPGYLKFYPSNALFYEMNRYYLQENGFEYVNAGFRRVLHVTNIQQYLTHTFHFKRVCVPVVLRYRKDVEFFLKVTRPYKKALSFLNSELAALYELDRAAAPASSPASGIDAAVTYGWNRVAYSMVRSLSKSGLRVAVGDSSSIAMAKASRHCASAFRYRSFYRDPQGFIRDLETALDRWKPKVYLPSHEETFVVARYKERLQKTGVKIPVADFDALRTLHRKDLLAAEARKLGIPTPKTVRLENPDDLEAVWSELGASGRVVVKMLNTNSSKGVFYAHSLAQLKDICAKLIKNGEDRPLIQEYVEGAGYGVSMLFNNGVLKAKFTHKRLREKLATGGTSTVRISTENAEMEAYAEKLLGHLKWHGVAMIEFKYDEASRRTWLIEANPRYWGSLALAIHAGVDFPLLSYRMALDGDVEPVTDYRKKVVSRWILGDVLAALDCVKSRKRMFNWSEFDRPGMNFDDFHSDDALPFFAQCGYYAKKFFKGFKLNPTDDSILDIDRI